MTCHSSPKQKRWPFALFIILSFFLLLPSPTSVAASERKALVIGNAAYQNYPLRNPVNDAIGMAESLKKSGFAVTLLTNADRRKMDKAIHLFGQQLNKDDVGLFYFAGHGIQYQGANYLIPVDAEINDEADVEYVAVDSSRVLSKMELAGNNINIVILDACRNNPYTRSFRSSERGLKIVNNPTGSLIAYSTAPGSVAADGQGNHGIYTGFLIK